MSSSDTFSVRVLCHAVSNTFVKSSAKDMDIQTVKRSMQNVCRMAISAAVVDLVGLNAY